VRRVVASVLALAVLALSACSGDDDGNPPAAADTSTPASTTAATTAVPGGDPGVVPDPLPAGQPGDLLAVRARQGADVPPGARAWDVLYLSTGMGGDPIAVSGVVLAPGGPAPPGGRPVLSWAHGTTGGADACAPSRAGLEIPYVDELLAAGYVVAATDFEGLGTPGPHPYLVGASEGRGVLDAARAAGRLEEAGAGSEVVLFGHSQGGHAALFAGELAPGYAPDLDLKGVVAGAPVGELSALMDAASGISFGVGFLATVAYGYDGVYDDVEPAAVFTPAGVDLLPTVDQGCLGEVVGAFASRPVAELVRASPLDDAAWSRRLKENEPGAAAVPAPVLVIQGGADPIVPPATTDITVERLCGAGTDVVYRQYPGTDHTGVLVPAAPDVLAFVADRVGGAPEPAGCAA
jgi:pimeloyl-ACP methyl ester carboxylesterase